MRTFAAFLVLAALGGLFMWQKNNHPAQAPAKPSAVQASAPIATPAAAAPAAAREPSEHNWMKRSLDRARNVRDQARTRTGDAQNP